MCGIAGYIGKRKINELIIRQTLDVMKNRGPDHQGHKYIQDGPVNIYFLHARLSIIDLDSRADQPFCLANCSLIFNGEIYNYVELREELKRRGETCTTACDTEVLLRYYLYYGEQCVDHFEGMWSFAIYDGRSHKLFLSRDRFAEKPLYYHEDKDGFYFGSQTSFLRTLSHKRFEVNHPHLLRHLVNGYQSLYKAKTTYFLGVEEIPYASSCVVSLDLKKKIYRYWQPHIHAKEMTITQAVEGTRHHLIESMKLRLRSDVPLAFCLSGGIDSSVLTSIAAKKFNYQVASFSILDSDERYNEYENIKATIDDIHCQSTFVRLKYENTLEKLKNLVAYHDAPVPTVTYLIHSYLTKAIAQQGYKVAFSGTGADELFSGDYNHFNLHLYETRNSPNRARYLEDWKNNILKIVRNPYLRDPDLYVNDPDFRDHYYDNYKEFSSYLNVDFFEKFTEEKFCSSLMRNRLLNELFYESIPVVLHEEDLNSMYCSIENRSPYLDKNLFEFVTSIPDEYLIQNGCGKYILREAAKGVLNDKVRLDRTKKGFNASLNSMIDFKDPSNRDHFLSDSPIFNYVNKAKIEQLIGMDPLSNAYNKFLFTFVNVKMFMELNG